MRDNEISLGVHPSELLHFPAASLTYSCWKEILIEKAHFVSTVHIIQLQKVRFKSRKTGKN